MRHLSDYSIQQYLESPEMSGKNEFENHLLVCFECQEKLEQYQELYQHLSVESEPGPDETFNTNVLSALERIESKKAFNRFVQFAGSILGVMLMAFSLSYFGLVNWQGLLSALQSASGKILSPLSQTTRLLVEKLNGNLELLAFAGLALLLFQLLDHSLVRHKTKHS